MHQEPVKFKTFTFYQTDQQDDLNRFINHIELNEDVNHMWGPKTVLATKREYIDLKVVETNPQALILVYRECVEPVNVDQLDAQTIKENRDFLDQYDQTHPKDEPETKSKSKKK